MTCPNPETLSRWSDGTLEPAEATAVDRHLEGCAGCRSKASALREAGAWVRAIGNPGSDCLTPEEVAVVLDGGPIPPHASVCPRCAAELADLRPPKRRTRLARFEKQSKGVLWIVTAAAAVLIAATVAIVLKPRPQPEAPVVRAPRPVVPEVVTPGVPIPEPTKAPAAVSETPAVPEAKPVPEKPLPPPVEPPKADPEPRPVPPGPAPGTVTIAEAPVRVEAVLALKSGGLLAQEGGKWQKPSRFLEGMPLRADGKTRLEFARAQVALDGAARFSVAREELTLIDGSLSAQVPPQSAFVLRLGNFRIVPQAAASRVLLSAANGRVVVDEGSARAGDLTLAEGVEHEVKADRLEPQKRRTVPPAARPRETPVWRLDLANRNATRGRLPRGTLQATPYGPVLASAPAEDPSSAAGIQYSLGGETDTFVLRPATAIRFRYFLKQPAPLEFVVRNRTKDESFGAKIDGPAGAWTTATYPVIDIPVKKGGRDVIAEAGDHYGWFGWNLGRSGAPGDLMVDRIEILEIDP
jgi:hypothetical protein